MSRSALVTMRWSNTKLPLSEPATTRSQGSQWRRSGSAKISSSVSPRASAWNADGDPQPERVEVAVQRVGLTACRAAAAWTGRLHELPRLGERVAGARRRYVERQEHGELLPGHSHRAAVRAVDDRNGRSPRALARDREVIGPIALRGTSRREDRRGGRGGLRRRRAAYACSRLRVSRSAIMPSVRSSSGMPSTAVAPKRPSTTGEMSTGSRPSPEGAPTRVAGVDQGDRVGVARAALEPTRAQLLQALAHLRVGGPDVDVGVLGGDQHEARPLEGVRVWREDRERALAGGRQVDLDAVDASEHEVLAGQRVLIPVLELGQAPVVLLHVGAHAEVPLRALDQADGVVTAPAQAVLDLDRGEGRLAGVAPVDGARSAIDEAGLEQREKQPLRPAVLDGVGAEEGALPVEGEAEAVELPGHVGGTAADPLAGWLSAGDRAELGRQAEGVESEGEQHRIAARAAKAGVGVADRVASERGPCGCCRR